MADVKIIDIDSEQWNMKDQNARDRLTSIESRPYIVKEDMESANKYRKWSDGILEQWFTVKKVVSRNASFSIQFPIQFDEAPIELNAFVKSKYGVSPVGVFAVSNDATISGSGCSLLFISIYNYQSSDADICVYAKGIKRNT